jgi:Restriction Endonuclease associating with ARP
MTAAFYNPTQKTGGPMTLSRDIAREQRKWAGARDIPVDRNGYVEDVAHNFHLPLSASFLKALDGAGGGELKDQRDRPAKIRALHSSAVLAINVFQYWEGRTGPDLPQALGLEGSLEKLEIERQFASGLKGTPPTLDVVLRLSGDRIVAIESKFTEWMTKKRPKLAAFREKYLQPGLDLWRGANLPRCQALATEIAAGEAEYRHLDALQLLKHALGLSKSAGQPFSLLYLYYEVGGQSATADRHRAEISRFAAAVDESLEFRALTYQRLFQSLEGIGGIEPGYLDYLRARYFRN